MQGIACPVQQAVAHHRGQSEVYLRGDKSITLPSYRVLT
jgi:hypothetical protein